MAAEKIYIVCPDCKGITSSGLSMDVQALAHLGTTVSNNQTQCPKCGHMILWSKAELIPESVANERGAQNPTVHL